MDPKTKAILQLYLKQIKSDAKKMTISTVTIATIFGVVLYTFPINFWGNALIVGLFIGIDLALWAKYYLTKYRIDKGWFATNAGEVREILAFMDKLLAKQCKKVTKI